MSKRVLVFCPYYLPHIGGLESHADEFNKYLVKNGFEITVFTPRLPKDSKEKEVKYKNVKIIRFPAWEIISNYPLPCFWNSEYWKLWNNLSIQKFDWVVSRTRFFMTSVMAGVFARKNKIRWLHVEHGSDFVQLNSRFKSFLAELFDYTFGRWVLKRADKVVANSMASAVFCKKLFSKIEYEVIYRGVELEGFEDNKKIMEEYRDKVKILFAGRLIDGKGVTDLVEAIKMIKFKKVVLLIVGDGPRRGDLEKQVENSGLKDKIIFLGQMERQKLMGIVNVVDVVVNPSYSEGIPTNVIEAAKCGKAIIATDVGGTREIFENNKSGILIPPRQPKILAEKIEMLINDPKLRDKMSSEAKKKVNSNFDWNVSIKKYINILK